MDEYIRKQSVIDEIEEWIYLCSDSQAEVKLLSVLKRSIKKMTSTDVRSESEISDGSDGIDEAIRVLNAINTSGRLDYADYSELHDVICSICGCGADMREA